MELVDRLLSLGDPARGDPELVQLLDLLLRALQLGLGRLTLLLERLRLLLEDPREAGGRERADTARSGRTTPLLPPTGPVTATGPIGHPFHARSPLLMKRGGTGAPHNLAFAGVRCG